MKKNLFILLTAFILPFASWSQHVIGLDEIPIESGEEEPPPPPLPPPVDWEDADSDGDVMDIRQPGYGEMCYRIADYKAEHPEQLGLEFGLPEMPDELSGFCPDDFVLLDTEPIPLNRESLRSKIQYPEILKAKGVEGKVVVRVRVDTKGNTTHCLIMRNPHNGLTEVVVAHILELRWKPGEIYGERVNCWVTLPFDFKLLR